MAMSIRLKPELEQLLDLRAKMERKTRTELVHEALSAWLKPANPKLGSAIRAALIEAPDGFGLERNQPLESDARDWPT